MTDDLFLMTYPAHVIGRAAGDGTAEQLAIKMIGDVSALPVFTEQIFAERFMDAENLDGAVFAVSDRIILAKLVRRYREHIELVIVDPNPATGAAVGFNVDVFLSGLDSPPYSADS